MNHNKTIYNNLLNIIEPTKPIKINYNKPLNFLVKDALLKPLFKDEFNVVDYNNFKYQKHSQNNSNYIREILE